MYSGSIFHLYGVFSRTSLNHCGQIQEKTNNLFSCDNHYYLIQLHCWLPINQWANELTNYEKYIHPVLVCIIPLMLLQRLSWRYWMIFKRSADIIIKGHHELAGCAVWELQAKETNGLWRRKKKGNLQSQYSQVVYVVAFITHNETTNSLLYKA